MAKGKGENVGWLDAPTCCESVEYRMPYLDSDHLKAFRSALVGFGLTESEQDYMFEQVRVCFAWRHIIASQHS